MHRRDGAGARLSRRGHRGRRDHLVHLGNAVGQLMTDVVRGGFGSMAWTLPILLGLLAWRLLRHPDRNADTGRMVIGWAALTVGVLGLVHIAHGTPSPPRRGRDPGRPGASSASSSRRRWSRRVTPWVAAPLLALVCGFGLLVITGTPLHRVPERPRRAARRRSRGRGGGGGGQDVRARPRRSQTGHGHRGGRSRQAIRHPATRWSRRCSGYRQAQGQGPGAGGAVPPRGSGRRRAGGLRDTEGLLDALGFGPTGSRPQTGAATGTPGAAQGRAAHARRGERRQLHAAARRAAAAGHRAKGADRGQRRGGARR